MTPHDGIRRKNLHDLRAYALTVVGLAILGGMFIGSLAYEKAKAKVKVWRSRLVR